MDDTSQPTAIEPQTRGVPGLGRVMREGVEILRGERASRPYRAKYPLEAQA